MSFSIGLYFDYRIEAAIRSVWKEMAERKIAPYWYNSANRPHFTLSIYPTFDPIKAKERLKEFALRQPPLPVSFQYIGVFPGLEPNVYLGPVVTRALLEIHQRIHDCFDDLGTLPDFDFYLSDSWIPHCGIATEMDPSHLLDAVKIATGQLVLPMDGQITEIGVIEFRPVKHLYWYQLCNP